MAAIPTARAKNSTVPPVSWDGAAGEREREMTVPTKTLLKQLAGEVEWLAAPWDAPENRGQGGVVMDEIEDHAEAALDIIEELEGHIHGAWLKDVLRDAVVAIFKKHMEADLHRLHDLIKGSASREAMDLIRSMMGG